MKIIYGKVSDLKKYCSENSPKYSVLLLSIKTDLPLAAWVPDGENGYIVTRKTLGKKELPTPYHCYGDNLNAYYILSRNIRKTRNNS